MLTPIVTEISPLSAHSREGSLGRYRPTVNVPPEPPDNVIRMDFGSGAVVFAAAA